jgi:hypothetical protein
MRSRSKEKYPTRRSASAGAALARRTMPDRAAPRGLWRRGRRTTTSQDARVGGMERGMRGLGFDRLVQVRGSLQNIQGVKRNATVLNRLDILGRTNLQQGFT